MDQISEYVYSSDLEEEEEEEIYLKKEEDKFVEQNLKKAFV